MVEGMGWTSLPVGEQTPVTEESQLSVVATELNMREGLALAAQLEFWASRRNPPRGQFVVKNGLSSGSQYIEQPQG